MNFERVWTHPSVKQYLQDSIDENRVSHAQLFVGKPGWGTLDMALAYTEKIISDGNPSSAQKVRNLSHSDLHFSIPTFKIDSREAVTKNYLKEFKSVIQDNRFAALSDWYAELDAGNKQGFLSKNEIEEVVSAMSLKSYEGGYKVLIIWNADKMKVDYANKFLKLLEEPPAKTLFLLLTEKPEQMLDTITSRCVKVPFKPLTDEQLMNYATQELDWDLSQNPDTLQSYLGDVRKLRESYQENPNRNIFESEFIEWTRNSFMVLKKLNLLQDIIAQAERIAGWNTEMQKQYLQFCIETFRSALLQNYQMPQLSFTEIEKEGFQFNQFAQYISGKNIEAIIEELNQTHYYVERNANKKLAFTNLGIKLTRLIQKH